MILYWFTLGLWPVTDATALRAGLRGIGTARDFGTVTLVQRSSEKRFPSFSIEFRPEIDFDGNRRREIVDFRSHLSLRLSPLI